MVVICEGSKFFLLCGRKQNKWWGIRWRVRIRDEGVVTGKELQFRKETGDPTLLQTSESYLFTRGGKAPSFSATSSFINHNHNHGDWIPFTFWNFIFIYQIRSTFLFLFTEFSTIKCSWLLTQKHPTSLLPLFSFLHYLNFLLTQVSFCSLMISKSYPLITPSFYVCLFIVVLQ